MATLFVIDNYLPGTAGTGGCYLCGASKRHPDEIIVDTGIDIDFEGRVAICEACIREMAGKVGMVNAAVLVSARVEMDTLAAALVEATERADAADEAARAVLAYRALDHELATGEHEQEQPAPKPRAKTKANA